MLAAIHGLLEPLVGAAAWGWAVVVLTVGVRLVLLPLAVKQFRAMRQMSRLRPELEAINERYPTSRTLRREDPERYEEHTQRRREEAAALYREHGVNPAAGCLPLVVQLPVFFALLRVLRSSPALNNAPFYVFTASVAATAEVHGLGAPVGTAGPAGWILVALMGATMVASQRQARRLRASSQEGASLARRVMGYLLPGILVVVAVRFPIGVLLYWVTSNLWQWGQQTILLREAAAGQPV